MNITKLTFLLAHCKDTLFPTADSYDLKMAKIDRFNINPPSLSNKLALEDANFQRLDTQVASIAGFTGLDNLYSITSKSLWANIYAYIMEHLSNFLKMGEFSFTFSIRHCHCFFVIPLSPTDHFLVFPSFYSTLLPSRFRNHPVVLKFLDSVGKFLEQVKQRSKTEVLIIYKAIKKMEVEDLSILKDIPSLIRTNPLKIILWLIDFNLEPIRY